MDDSEDFTPSHRHYTIIVFMLYIAINYEVLTTSVYAQSHQSGVVFTSPKLFKTMNHYRRPNRVFGKTEDYGFLSVKKVKT